MPIAPQQVCTGGPIRSAGTPGAGLWGEVLAGSGQTELVEAGERGDIWSGEGTVGHVEVFRDGYCLATSILEASACVWGVRRAGPGCAGGVRRLHTQLRSAVMPADPVQPQPVQPPGHSPHTAGDTVGDGQFVGDPAGAPLVLVATIR